MGRQTSKGNSGRLRVIGGEWRGRKLAFPEGDGLRPTSDRIRETLFNWLAPRVAGARCLDLFSGSGALGIEALSRGATHCEFVDLNPIALQSIEENLTLLGGRERSGLILGDALSVGLKGQFDLVFVDPPFARDLTVPAIRRLISEDQLTTDAWLYVESPAREPFDDLPAGLECIRNRQAGEVCYQLFEVTPGV